MICLINSSSWPRACSSLPSAASPNSFSSRSSGSTPPLNSASRIASWRACIVRSLSSSVSRGFPNPLDISRSDSFDMSSSMSSSSSRLGTYFPYLNFKTLGPQDRGTSTSVVILLLAPNVRRLLFLVLREERCARLRLRPTDGLGAVIPALFGAADLLLRVEAFEQEIDGGGDRRRRRTPVEAGALDG